MTTYSDIAKYARPFDIIAFRGGDLLSDVICMLEKYDVGHGDFTHIGIVVTSELMPHHGLKPGKLYLYQSTINILPSADHDVVSNKCEVGVQLCDLESVVEKYLVDSVTKVAYCQLINAPKITQEIIDIFAIFYTKYDDRLYELNVFSLLATVFPAFRNMRDSSDLVFSKLARKLGKICSRFGIAIDINDYDIANWVFCSELVVRVYQSIGVIASAVDPRNVLPIDFFASTSDDNLPMIITDPVYFK